MKMITKTYTFTLTEDQAKDLYNLLYLNQKLSPELDRLYLELKEALNQ